MCQTVSLQQRLSPRESGSDEFSNESERDPTGPAMITTMMSYQRRGDAGTFMVDRRCGFLLAKATTQLGGSWQVTFAAWGTSGLARMALTAAAQRDGQGTRKAPCPFLSSIVAFQGLSFLAISRCPAARSLS